MFVEASSVYVLSLLGLKWNACHYTVALHRDHESRNHKNEKGRSLRLCGRRGYDKGLDRDNRDEDHGRTQEIDSLQKNSSSRSLNLAETKRYTNYGGGD